MRSVKYRSCGSFRADYFHIQHLHFVVDVWHKSCGEEGRRSFNDSGVIEGKVSLNIKPSQVYLHVFVCL